MSIFFKAFLVGTGALFATVFLILGMLTLTGDAYQPTMMINSVIGCYTIGSPVSYYLMKQSEKYKAALVETEKLHQQLAKAHEELQRHSQLDIMTGMLNREAFFEAVEEAKEAAPDQNSAMLIADIDHFKQINDSWGHLEGDRAIILVAQAIQNTVADSAIAGRIGGEEFALFLPELNHEDTKAIAEKVRQAVEDIEFYPAEKIRQNLSLSIGGAKADNTGVTTDLIRRADRILYNAKDAGRNRVRIEAAA